MKIAMVFASLNLGGCERVGVNYVRIMVSMGHTVDVYNLSPKLHEMVNEIPNKAHYIPLNFKNYWFPEHYARWIIKYRWGKYIFSTVYLIVKASLFFRKLARPNENYDITIAFSGDILDLGFVAHNFLKTKKKIAWTHRGDLTLYLLKSNGYAMLFPKVKNIVILSAPIQPWTPILYPMLQGLNIKKIYNPTYISKSDTTIENVNLLKEKYGRFVLNVSRFREDKDHKTIIRAVKILKDTGISNKFLFVGDGVTRVEIEKYATEMGVGSNCIFCGATFNVQQYYLAAEVFVHSSPSEGFGLIFTEAMTYGVPIVSTNSIPGVNEVLENGKYGIIVPVGDAQALANGLKTMLTEPEIRNIYIELGFERAKAFTPETITKELTEFFNSLI